jgi:hypothetical protein
MHKFDDLRTPPPDIKTRAELDQRTKERWRPAPQRHHLPEGCEVETWRSNTLNEGRIRDIEQRFSDLKGRFERDQRLSSVKGTLRRDFDQDR